MASCRVTMTSCFYADIAVCYAAITAAASCSCCSCCGGSSSSAGAQTAATAATPSHWQLLLLLLLVSVASCCCVVVHESGHVLLEAGPGLGVPVAELLQDQLVGQGPGHPKPAGFSTSYTYCRYSMFTYRMTPFFLQRTHRILT